MRLSKRVTPFIFNSIFVAHAGAQGRGHLLAVYMCRNEDTAAARLPVRFVILDTCASEESPISFYEICAAVLLVCISLDWARSRLRTCVLFLGNKAAVAALVKVVPTS